MGQGKLLQVLRGWSDLNKGQGLIMHRPEGHNSTANCRLSVKTLWARADLHAYKGSWSRLDKRQEKNWVKQVGWCGEWVGGRQTNHVYFELWSWGRHPGGGWISAGIGCHLVIDSGHLLLLWRWCWLRHLYHHSCPQFTYLTLWGGEEDIECREVVYKEFEVLVQAEKVGLLGICYKAH